MGILTRKEEMVADPDIGYAYFAGIFDIFHSKQRGSPVYLCAFLIHD